jgi:GT2 family glycosyltransferase
VILNWRTAPMTLRAVAAATVAMQGLPGAITVVDNDSGDGSFEALVAGTADNPRVRVVQAGRNGGFGAGNNVGIRLGLPGGARPDLVYVLNSDAFPEPGAIAALRDHLVAHPEAGLAGSHILGEDGHDHETCFRFPSVASEFEDAAATGPISRLLARWRVPIGVPASTRRVDWLAGASVMIRTEVLERVGLFDEGFFLYYEETDLCFRAAEAGWQTHFVRESRVTHIGSVSTGMKEWRRVPGYWFDSRWRYFAKRGGRGLALAATLARLAGSGLRGLRRLVQRRLDPPPPKFLPDLVSNALHQVRRPLDIPPDARSDPRRRLPT